jgi:hypothetical protein
VKQGTVIVLLMEFVMLPSSNGALAPFATLTGVAMPAAQHRAGLAAFFFAPFRDVDDRVARKLAAQRAEREARQAAMSVAV